MSKQKIIGHCRLCIRKTELTFEHVPPKAAFNNRKIIVLDFDRAFDLGPDDKIPRGPISQKGSGCVPIIELE